YLVLHQKQIAYAIILFHSARFSQEQLKLPIRGEILLATVSHLLTERGGRTVTSIHSNYHKSCISIFIFISTIMSLLIPPPLYLSIYLSLSFHFSQKGERY